MNASLEELLGVSKVEVNRGLDLHKKSIIFDSQCQEPAVFTKSLVEKTNELLDKGFSGWRAFNEVDRYRVAEIASGGKAQDMFFDAWKRSGVTAICRTIGSGLDGVSHLNRMMDVLGNLGLYVKATRAEDVERAKREGKHAIVYDFQNTIAFEAPRYNVEDNLRLLENYYNVGVRMIQLTYNVRNLVGDGCTERCQSGLSRYGVKVIEKMNELGIIVDTGHTAYQTVMDAIEVSKDPVVDSHTSCRGLYDHPRAKTDELLQAVAESGGYIGIYTHPAFLAEGGLGTFTDFLNHIDYAVDLIGVDHVGVGTDSWDITGIPDRLIESMDRDVGRFWTGFTKEHGISRWRHPPKKGPMAWANWPSITVGLVSRGYSDQDIKKIIGENFLKIFRRIVG